MFKWAKQPGCKFVTVLSLELSDLRGRDVASPARGRRRRLAARETGAKGRNRARTLRYVKAAAKPVRYRACSSSWSRTHDDPRQVGDDNGYSYGIA
jgi:hypothetical protein